MSDEKRTEPEPQDSGVFGKLPSTRPGVRSPRRGKGSAKGRPARSAKTSGHSSTPSSPPQPEPTPPAGAVTEPETPHPGDGPGVEDLAWAGITVAAEAATLGVRLLSRALEAVRGPGDSR